MSFDKDSIKTVKQALEICKSYRAKKEALEEFAGADTAIQAKIQEYDTIIQGYTQLVMFQLAVLHPAHFLKAAQL